MITILNIVGGIALIVGVVLWIAMLMLGLSQRHAEPDHTSSESPKAPK